MESPTLSRSSSFAPGPHRRRSHPNLHHLSLAPLTPKYPIDPADYSAYFDPSTSELHTTASISQIASLPSPGGILSSSANHSATHSRASSRTRQKHKPNTNNSTNSNTRLTLSVPPSSAHHHGDQGHHYYRDHQHNYHPHHLHPGTSTPSGALTSEGFGHKQQPHHQNHGLNIQTSDPSWLIQTGLTLTEGSRESKGQSWIFKRDSSTSLHTPVEERDTSRLPLRSGRATPSISRRSSQRRSRRSLAMTPAPVTPVMDEPAPDWADDQTQAEIAAHIESEFTDELDEDPYGLLDFEGQFDSEDEEDVRQEISKYRLGRWMDGIVDVFLRLEDFPESSHQHPPPDLEAAIPPAPAPAPVVSAKDEDAASVVSITSVEPPPEKPTGIWDDVAWFGRLIARTVRS
ncbi:hypothetical protein KCU88_g5186, partial [Aureobasidium melanogenum]